MREIVLDVETTGLDPLEDRIVEIGCVELRNRVPTGERYQRYVNPERDMPKGAFKVHGLSDELLRDRPKFAEVIKEFLDFIGDSNLVIHNAKFDMKFLNASLERQNLPPLPMSRAVDTVALARKKFPGSPASLDALCGRFGIDNSVRTLRRALLDAQILAEVYPALTGGRQPNFVPSTDYRMREIVLDIETTGSDPRGDRIVEISCVELRNRVPTNEHYQRYINPERDMPKEFQVHGLSDEWLRKKPKFVEVVKEFLDFIGDSHLVIHNANAMKFLNASLERQDLLPLPMSRVVDTVKLAREKFSGSPASLGDLCEHFGIDNFAGKLHCALLDAQILAEVYLELNVRREFVLPTDPRKSAGADDDVSWKPQPRPEPLPPRITDEEARAHSEFIENLGPNALW